jgi:hypothetical protein
LWRYTKGNPPFPGVSPKSATSIEGYFADPVDASLETRVETRLANEIEDPVHKFLPEFCKMNWVMSDLQRKQMTRYITLLFNRCQARREATRHTQEITARALHKFINNEIQLITVAAHWSINAVLKGISLERLITPHDVANAAKKMLALSQTDSARQESFVKVVVTAMAMFDEAMFRGIWEIIRTTIDDPFILSDTPVVTWERRENGAFNYGLGFARPNLEVLLPISPLACLHIVPRVKRTQNPQPPTVKEINTAQAAFSHRACFANQRKKEIDDIMQSHAHAAQLGRNAFTLWHRNVDDMFYEILMQQS